ncbi:toll-like receptor 4 [Wyeomyia smithii]|uniref:toll-like receptor 4 n=1 Tax=Wyeomyia smithii TaxID=174621 RepID=UPI002467C5D3|nr:toll-like receptor 4 [Wyeomyia smithii]
MDRLCVLLTLLVLVLGALAAPSPAELSCTKHGTDPECIISNITFESTNPEEYIFPKEIAIQLANCTMECFSPELAARLSEVTTELSILDGVAPKLYVKPSLKKITCLRAATSTVLIDPVENHNLELLDLEGVLTAIPENIHYLKKLQVLDLCQNQIDHVKLDAFQGLNHLRKINLGHNRIQSVDSTGNTINLPALTELFLHGNQLTALDLTHLKADNLQRFYVSENQLTRIDSNFPHQFPNLVRTDLFRNKWICEWLEETLRTLNASKVETHSYLPSKICDERGSVKVDVVDCESAIDI